MNLQDLSQCPPRLQRLKLRLAPFYFRVEYVPGKAIPVADALSRAPVGKGENTMVDDIEAYVNIVTVAGLPVSDVLFEEFRVATQEDRQLSVLQSYLESSWPKERHNVRHEARSFWDIRHSLSCLEGLILRGDQIVVPTALRRVMIDRVHEGHLGLVKTKARAREHLWWPGMAKDLEEAVLPCDVCAHFKHQQRREPLQSTPMPDRPWQQVGSDLFEVDGKHYLLIVDYYSRFPELRRLSNLRATDVIAACQEIFACHGIPELFVSDNGPQYANGLFGRFAADYGLQHATSSPHYPQGNGLAERTVQTIKGLLQKSVYSGNDFQMALLAYRTTPHETTGVAPAQLLMGRRLRTRLPALSSHLGPAVVDASRLKEVDASKKQKQAEDYNRRHGVKALDALEKGDSVLVWDLQTRTWRIPETIVRRLSGRSYLVQLPSGRRYRRNRYQIQARPEGVNEISDEDEDYGWDENSTNPREDGSATGDNGINPAAAAAERAASQREERGNEVPVTKSGREVKPPFWHKDYVVEKN